MHFTRTTKKISADMVRDSLIVLLHHNCVEVCIPALDDDEDSVSPANVDVEYTLNVNAVVSRLRFPHMISCVSKNLGALESDIFEEMIVGGRLTIGQLLERMEHKLSRSSLHENISQENLKTAFESLIKRRYLVSSPTIETLLARLVANATSNAAAAEAKNAAARKRKTMDNADATTVSVTSTSTSSSQPISKRAAVDRSSRATLSSSNQTLPLEMRLMMQQRAEAMGLTPAANGEATTSETQQTTPHASSATGGRGAGRGGRGRGRGGRGRGAGATSSDNGGGGSTEASGSDERFKSTESLVVCNSYFVARLSISNGMIVCRGLEKMCSGLGAGSNLFVSTVTKYVWM